MFSFKKIAAVTAAAALVFTGLVATPANADGGSTGSVTTTGYSEVTSAGAVVSGTATNLSGGYGHFCVSLSSARASDGHLVTTVSCSDATSPANGLITSNATTAFSGPVFGLAPNTTYYYQAIVAIAKSESEYTHKSGDTESDSNNDKSYKKNEHGDTKKDQGGEGNHDDYELKFIYGGVQSFTTDSVVTFKKNDGSTDSLPQDYALGEDACSFDPGWTRAGYTFEGWNTDPNATVGLDSCPVDGNKDLYAIWKKIPVDKVVLTLNLNGGKYNNSTTNPTESVDPGSQYTITQIPTKTGCTFAGWLIAPTVYQVPATITVAGATTAVAQWTNCPSGGGSGGPALVSITYNSNNPAALTSTIQVVSGSPVSLSTPSWTYPGYTFTGWSTSATGSVISGSLNATANLTLYAIWASTGVQTVLTNYRSVVVNLNTGTYTFPTALSNSPAPISVNVVCNGAGSVVDRTITLIAPGTCLVTASQPAILGYTAGTMSMTVTIISYDPTDPGTTGSKVTTTLNRINGMVTLKSVVDGETDPTWELNLQGLDKNGAPAAMDPKDRIIFETGHQAATFGNGFMPNSDVYVYIFSTPILLGILKTDANGSFVGSFTMPAGLEDGVHTIQVKGVTPDELMRTATVDVILDNANKSTRVIEKRVFFNPDSPKLSKAVVADLKKIAAIIKGKSNIRIDAKGWVFGHGKTSFEKKLSTKRANNVASFFKKLGIKATFTHKGNGKAPEKNLTARRVDLLINYTLITK